MVHLLVTVSNNIGDTIVTIIPAGNTHVASQPSATAYPAIAVAPDMLQPPALVTPATAIASAALQHPVLTAPNGGQLRRPDNHKSATRTHTIGVL